MIIRDNMIWLDITDKAEDVYASNLFACYVLYEDGSEALIETIKDLQCQLHFNRTIAIEVGILKCSRCGQSELIDQDCIICDSCMEDLTGDIYEQGNLGL